MNQIKNSIFYNTFYPYFVFLLASLFYIYEFCLRVMPSTMTHQLMMHYHLTAQGLGLLVSLFYFGYTPMQIPAGLLYDRIRPRILLSLGILLCAVASYAFGHASSVFIASIARLMIGLTSSFAFIGALLVASRWFPTTLRHTSWCCAIIRICVGAIMGEAPIATLVAHKGWLSSINIIAFVGLILSILVFTFIRSHPKYKNDSDQSKVKNYRSCKVCVAYYKDKLGGLLAMLFAAGRLFLFLPLYGDQVPFIWNIIIP